MKFISILPRCILNSPTGKLVKTESNMKFISQNKSAGGIRLRSWYHVHGIYFLSAKKSLVFSASTRSSVKM